MDPISIAVLGLTVAKGVSSLLSGQEAARQKRAETTEAVRRLRLDQSRTLGQAQAVGAASGVEFSSASTQTYLASMSAEFKREADWMTRAGSAQASAASNAAGFNLATDLGAGLFQFGASNNWFREPTIK